MSLDILPFLLLSMIYPLCQTILLLRKVQTDLSLSLDGKLLTTHFLGARAMHAVQTYGQEEQLFDGNAYTFSSIYQWPTQV